MLEITLLPLGKIMTCSSRANRKLSSSMPIEFPGNLPSTRNRIRHPIGKVYNQWRPLLDMGTTDRNQKFC